jgi:clan AA aspartic protease
VIFGVVNARHELVLRVPVVDASGQEQEVEAVLDTGFTGSLTLPPALVAALGLPWRSRSHVVLADGRVEQYEAHVAEVIWDGTPRTILVQAVDTAPLVGVGLLIGYDLWARVRPGGDVRIEASP